MNRDNWSSIHAPPQPTTAKAGWRLTLIANPDCTTAKAVADLPDGLSPALNTDQAARYTGLAVATLEKMRCTGGGPRFVRYGRKAVRYVVADLNNWMSARTVGSTSEPVAA